VLVLVVVGGLGRQFLLNARGVDDDGRFPIDRTFVLTDATARALLFFNGRPLLLITHDRMVGTLLIADEANLFRIPGNASGFVNMSDTYLEEALLFNRKRPDRICGTDPPAKIAEFFAVANAGNEPRSIKT
jgi:hypothetical protein